MPSPRDRLARRWRRLGGSALGRRIFALGLRLAVPYSGALGAQVVQLEPGFCRATLGDRRGVRNHLDSVHAVALINLGELTSGLAMTMALPDEVRGIVTALGATYHKKARGTLTAKSTVVIPAVGEAGADVSVAAVITDASGEMVCRVEAVWRLERRAQRQR
ncbi:MAG: DUF4442 domain-containing protein [Gemmatimonadetes bacterium]|nr:DUF4442 domain-containing protein [Gemmatimonadota bacterium]